MNHVKIAVDPHGVATITLDHADEAMNLVSPEWIEEFGAAIDKVASDASIKGAIVTSAKSTFMAGADLKLFAKRFSLREALDFSKAASRLFRRIETCGKPFVAAINGLALGGGFELALACHGRILVDNPRAMVGLPEINVGLLPGAGGTQRLVRMLGAEAALDMLLSGTSMPPSKALAAGLVDRLVTADTLIGASLAWLRTNPSPLQSWDQKGFSLPDAKGLLNPSAAGLFSAKAAEAAARTFHNTPASAAILSAVFEGMQLPIDKALAVESKYFAKLLSGDVARNVIRTMFVNKGLADKLGARPDGVAKARFDSIGVLGAGMMGAGIAFAAAVAGSQIILIDRTSEDAARGKAYTAKILERDVERGRRTRTEADAILERILPTTDFGALAETSLTVEAVFEDTSVKSDVIRRTEAVTRSGSVFASNTSTLPISKLAEASIHPDRFIGMHFFSPVEKMPLVEVIVGRATSEATIAHALDFVEYLRKTPIVVRDSRGFYTSRVFLSYIHEGMAMLEEGISPALIENAARFVGMPVGPLAVTDEVSLDLPLKIIRQTEAELGAAFPRPCGYAVIERMTQSLHRNGRGTGAGFYDYPASGVKNLWQGLNAHFPVKPDQPDAKQLGLRLLCRQALEAARCIEEGVLTSAADGDLGSILGVGFPSYTGGTLSFIDTMGAQTFVERCDRLAQRHGERFLPSEWLRRRAAAEQTFHELG